MSREEQMPSSEHPSSSANLHNIGHPSNTIEHGTDMPGSNMLEASNT